MKDGGTHDNAGTLEYSNVSDPRDIEALKVFRETIKISFSTIPQDLLTEDVACKTIEAASYMAWRSIMGGKYPEEEQKRAARTYRV